MIILFHQKSDQWHSVWSASVSVDTKFDLRNLSEDFAENTTISSKEEVENNEMHLGDIVFLR